MGQNCNWQNGNSEVSWKLLTLNNNILKTARRRKFKFGKNASKAFSSILVNSEKLDLNAPLISLWHILRKKNHF